MWWCQPDFEQEAQGQEPGTGAEDFSLIPRGNEAVLASGWLMGHLSPPAALVFPGE